MKNAKASEHLYFVFHWSFPPESPFIIKNTFMDFSQKSEESKNEYFKSLLNQSDFNLMLNFFYKYAFDSNNPDEDIKRDVLNGIKTTLVNYIKPGNYRVFLHLFTFQTPIFI